MEITLNLRGELTYNNIDLQNYEPRFPFIYLDLL